MRPQATSEVGGKHKFYNLLWISWQGSVAYSNAIWRVPKHIRGREDLEGINSVAIGKKAEVSVGCMQTPPSRL
jgi:hypothetical protein